MAPDLSAPPSPTGNDFLVKLSFSSGISPIFLFLFLPPPPPPPPPAIVNRFWICGWRRRSVQKFPFARRGSVGMHQSSPASLALLRTDIALLLPSLSFHSPPYPLRKFQLAAAWIFFLQNVCCCLGTYDVNWALLFPLPLPPYPFFKNCFILIKKIRIKISVSLISFSTDIFCEFSFTSDSGNCGAASVTRIFSLSLDQ